ncbi:MAG: hypothetical protein K5695_15335 [Oscillospiraceae bacterium]|nr:hypothetical protein [Oscillospiraceae bacterium]
MITALYDCRSKQEYIYRTNRIREISGASLILASVYRWMLTEVESHGIRILNSWKEDLKAGKPFVKEEFKQAGYDGVVIYEGGGNLYVLYKDKETFVRVNRIFSNMLLRRTYSVSVIAAWTETTDDFCKDRTELYRAKTRAKNLGTYSAPCNVLPFTMIDRQTYLPICSREKLDQKSEWTMESLKKQRYYTKHEQECSTDWLDELVKDKGTDSMLAVIYIDGNDMGNKIKKCTEGLTDYTESVKVLRDFSVRTRECFVDAPLRAIEERLAKLNERDAGKPKSKPHKYRCIISDGDEITLVCRASDAADIVEAYFEALGKTEPLVPGIRNASCAGIAIFHSHAPFADVYQIAEACCESGKKKTRSSGSEVSYIDFHYCHAGITNELDVLREEQEQRYTARPYTVEDFAAFRDLMQILGKRCIGRSNVKSIGETIVRGDGAYQFELERICGRDTDGAFTGLVRAQTPGLKEQLYDASIVFDLWAEKEDA